MPGHWLIEFASLTCAALFCILTGTPITDTTGMRIVDLDGCRFHSEVLPGMILCCTATLMKQKKGFVVFSADITRIVDGESVRVCQINRLTGAIVQG
jgi:3-hydroxymyristoyl/3-hydroxydecanoyl-(acyl carrier protein) dehydratase